MSDDPITEADLQAWVDGQLTPERAEQIAAWLAVHPEDARRLETYRAQTATLREAFAPIAAEPLPPRLDLRLYTARDRPAARRAMAAAGMTAMLLTGAASGWMLRDLTGPATVGTAALAREAAASYAVYADDSVRPVEISATDLPALNAWFSKRLSRRIAAPDLRAAGLRLVGGRLVATEHGAGCFYLYVDGAGQRIALYIRPMEFQGTDSMVRRNQDGVRGWTWADDGLGFGVFGARSEQSLRAFANAVRESVRVGNDKIAPS